MYPVLKDCLVRGFGDDLFLQRYVSGGAEIRLGDQLLADTLLMCTGGNSIDEIVNNANTNTHKSDKIERSDLEVFLRTLEDAGFVEFKSNAMSSPLWFPKLQNPQIYDIQIEGTRYCNLQCKHCFGSGYFTRSRDNDVSLQIYKTLFRQMEQLNVPNAFLSGGEFFTRKEAPEIIRELNKRRISIRGIFTNGTVWRQEIFDTLSDLNLAPLILISLDGIGNIHDKIRGSGNYSKTIQFVKKVIGLGYKVNINTVLNPYNLDQIMELAKLCDNMGVFRFRVAYPREQGGVAVDPSLLPPEGVYQVFKQLLRYFLDYKGDMKVQLSAMFKSELLENGKYYLYRDSSGTCDYKRHSMAFHGDGSMSACPAALEFPLAKFPEISLKECWESDLMRAIKTIPVGKTECKDCELRIYCGGGCRVMAFTKHGKFTGKDTNQCNFYRFFADTFVPMLSEAGIEAVPLDEAPQYRFNTDIIENAISTSLKQVNINKKAEQTN